MNMRQAWHVPTFKFQNWVAGVTRGAGVAHVQLVLVATQTRLPLKHAEGFALQHTLCLVWGLCTIKLA